MKTTTNYNVILRGQDWDSRGQQWNGTTSETLHTTPNLDDAKAVFRAAWEDREAHASAHQGPVELELEVVTTDEEGAEESEAYSAEPAPNGDTTWHCFYDGEDMAGSYVLWAKRDGGYEHDPFGIIGRHQKEHFSTGEWALRHCKDERGAIHAEHLCKTAEELAAYFHAEVQDVYHNADRLQYLADLGAAQSAAVIARYEYRATDGSTWACATLPDGTEWEVNGGINELENETRHAFDAEGRLYTIELPERETVHVELHDPTGADGKYMSAADTIPSAEGAATFSSEPDRSCFDGYEPGDEFDHDGEYPYTIVLGTEHQIAQWAERETA